MKHLKCIRPAADDGEALKVDRAGELDHLQIYHHHLKNQPLRLVGYVLDRHLLVVEVRHGL